MDLDELKMRWAAMDAKLDAVLALNTRAVCELKLAPVRTALGRLAGGVVAELVLNAAAVLLLGGYAAERFGAGKLRLALPGLALMLGSVALLHVGARQLLAIRSIDYGVPVAAIQRQIEAVRMTELRTMHWVLLLAPLVWTPMLIVAFDAFLGIDAWVALGVRYLVANLLVGGVFLAGMWWVSRRFAERMRMGRWGWARRVMRDIGGHNLRVARAFLESLGEMEET